MRAFVIAGMLLLAMGPSPAASQEVVCFEAESALAVSAPMSVTNRAPESATASGGRYVEVRQGKGNPPEVTGGTASYEFDLAEKGTYRLWCRAWWEDSCGNSLSVILDDQPPFTFGQDGTYKQWHWVKSSRRQPQLRLEPGRHRLRILNREDGVRIDQILFTADRRYVPVDVEDVTVAGKP